jgi:hypothetical protein
MIIDSDCRPRYYDKPFLTNASPPSPELVALYREMEANPKFHISKECNFYPKGFPAFSPGWGYS